MAPAFGRTALPHPGPAPTTRHPAGPTPTEGILSGPIPQGVAPGAGDPGDIFTVTVTGSGLADVIRCDFGEGTATGELRVLSDAELTVKLYVYATARSGRRDVTCTDRAGRTGTLPGGFTVR